MFTPGGQLDLLGFAGIRGGGKGGGGGGSAPTPTPRTVLTDPVSGKSFMDPLTETDAFGNSMLPPQGMSAQDQLNAEIDARKADEKTASDAATAKTASDKQAAEDTFQGRKQTAYNDALAAITHQFSQQGVDPNQYLASDIVPQLTAKMNAIPDLDPNPSSAFSSDLGTTILNNLTSGRRTTATNTLNSVFTPTYSQNAIPDSLTGQYSDTLINEQLDPLSAQLQNAMKRGTLNDIGYNAALGKLAQTRSAAQSTLDNLGKGIISSDRSALDNYITGARGDVNSMNLATNFDPNTYYAGAKNLAASDITNFGGALRSALGGTQFADLGSLINAGGAVQGAAPSAATPVAGGVLDDPNANVKRGLGNTGAF